jgi:hypothetical protein
MDKDLAGGNIGDVGSYKVAFSGGKLVCSANVALPPGEKANLSIEVDAGKVLDALKEAVPGKLDDMLIGLIKSALGI